MQNDNAFFENACGMSSIQMLIETLVHLPPPPPSQSPKKKVVSTVYTIFLYIKWFLYFRAQKCLMNGK